MCGIVGVVGRGEAAPLLLEALRRLEYRGYDSAGIATLVDGHIERRRAEGKLGNLAGVLERAPLPGTTGIGHTRWATHGAPTERNAHPHSTAPRQRGAQRHHREPRRAARRAGGRGRGVRDRDRHRDLRPPGGLAPGAGRGAGARPSRAALKRVHGAFALAAVFAGHPRMLIAARQGAPLAVGFGEGEMFVGSDALALAPLTRRIAYLEEGDWAVVTDEGARFHDAAAPAGGARDPRHRAVRRRRPARATTATSWRRSCTSTRRCWATRCASTSTPRRWRCGCRACPSTRRGCRA